MSTAGSRRSPRAYAQPAPQAPAPAPAEVPGAARASAPAVALSWQRCRGRGLDPSVAAPLRPAANPPETPAAPYLTLVRPVLEDIYQFVEGSQCVIGFVDAEARLLDTIGDDELHSEIDALGWVLHSCWSEECVGTNAIALALLDAFPIQVCGAAQYATRLQPYCLSAAPVHDSLGGVIGALVAVTRASNAHPHTLATISAAAGALTNELTMHLWLSSANELLSEQHAILQTLSEAILLLQPDGTIKQLNSRAGHLLGLVPARVAGKRLADVIEMPAILSAALHDRRELHDDEVNFRVAGQRVACVCTLRAITAPMTQAPLPGVTAGGARIGGAPHIGISVMPQHANSGFVLTLRSIERVQRLVHRITGTEARMRFENILGHSPLVLEAVRLAQIAANSVSTVLIHGETGTGKEIFAQSIHNGSKRADGPFIAINCAAIPRELISSELFGYEGGAFTGADRQGRLGKFQLAHGGTLFLDEIGDMPPDLQTSLLRAIETRTVTRVGGHTVVPVDVRIIAATHKDLHDEVQWGHFRSDLFFRLNVFPIAVPALRERPGDIAVLLRYILQRLSTRLGRSLGIEADAVTALEAYSWPGNVRELENVIERAVYVSGRNILTLRDLPNEIRQVAGTAPGAAAGAAWNQFGALGVAPRADAFRAAALHNDASRPAGRGLYAGRGEGRNQELHDLRSEAEQAEATVIQRALQHSGGNATQAAQLLGINRTTLWRKKQRYGL